MGQCEGALRAARASARLTWPALRERLELVTAPDEYVFGYCLHEAQNAVEPSRPCDDAGPSYIDTLIDNGDYPTLAKFA